jgi:dTDP-4-amino-4,6-dideoxygalactose transaminase
VPLHNIVFASDADAFVQRMGGHGISAARPYRVISEHPPYAGLAGDHPNSRWWREHAVYLPFGYSLTVDDGHRIADAVTASDGELLEIG